MAITIHGTFLPHDDPDASLASYRDTFRFEVGNDVGYGGKCRPPLPRSASSPGSI